MPTEAGGLSGHYAQSDAERERVEKEIVKAEDKRTKAEAEKAAAAETENGHKQLDAAKRAAFLSGRRHSGAIPAEVGAEARAKRAASVQGYRDTPSLKQKRSDGDNTASPPKGQSNQGTAGTFCGRRPPKDPASRIEFEAVREAYHLLVAKNKEFVKHGKTKKTLCKIPPTMSQDEYRKDVHMRIEAIKVEKPGLPGAEYVHLACQQLQQDRWASGSGRVKGKSKGKTGKATGEGQGKTEKTAGKVGKPQAKANGKSGATANRESKKKDDQKDEAKAQAKATSEAKAKAKAKAKGKAKGKAKAKAKAKGKAKAKAKGKSKKNGKAQEEKNDEVKDQEKDMGTNEGNHNTAGELVQDKEEKDDNEVHVNNEEGEEGEEEEREKDEEEQEEEDEEKDA